MMAKRDLLHMNHLKDLEKWLVERGYSIKQPNEYASEVLRAATDSNTVVIYRRNSACEHCTVKDKDVYLIWQFIKERRKKNGEGKQRKV